MFNKTISTHKTENSQKVLIMRNYDIKTEWDWWPVFFYRFSNVETRWKENLNYIDRIRKAKATILPYGWVVFDCTSDHITPISKT